MGKLNVKPDQSNSARWFHASTIARVNTSLSLLAFILALFFGSLLHYKKIVKNSVAGYPQEWFPSVSATIGDWYPERSIFQVICACAAGPRFASILMLYQFASCQLPPSNVPLILLVSGIIRTLACGGWMFVTSSDDHAVHDACMILYILCNVPWMYSSIVSTPPTNPKARRLRCLLCAIFFASIVPLVYFFIQHKVNRIPGSYTHYSFFEWGLIACDIFFDSVVYSDFHFIEVHLVVKKGAASSSQDKCLALTEDPTIPPLACAETQVSEESGIRKDTLKIHGVTPMVHPWRDRAEFASDLYTAYMFWSIFTSLIPSLFWFSVWELGIAGHELALLGCLSPVVYTVPGALDFAQTRWGMTILHSCSLLGLLAYAVPGPLGRLYVVSIANIAAILHQVAFWSQDDHSGSLYPGFVTALGLLISSLSKHMNYSLNPVWPFTDLESWPLNALGVLFATLAVIEHHNRLVWDSREIHNRHTRKPLSFSAQDHLFTSLPLGSLFFTLHSLMSDSGTLVAWSWTGYRNYQPNGPLPHYHGSLTLLAQSLGVFALTYLSLGISPATMILHPFWLIFGVGCYFVTYRYQNWTGFYGSLGFCVFIMSIAPALMQPRWPRDKSWQVYFVAMLTYCILGLASVWTVAYAFVPGGQYLRERSDIVSVVQLALLAPAFHSPWTKRSPVFSNMRYTAISFIKTSLSLISILALLSTLYQYPVRSSPTHTNVPSVVTAGVWTLHFGLNNHGRDSQRQLQKIIRNLNLDVVGFLETDLHRIVFGHRDLTLRIIEESGYYVDLGPTGPKSHTWGAVLLSRFPIVNSTHHLLPSPRGELALAIEAVIDIRGTFVTVVVAHNGQEEDPLDRELQSIELARIMASSYPRPVIFLGYVVTKPLAPRPNPYEILVIDGMVHDIDKDDADRWCEYIFYRGLYRIAYARISRGTVTDTELQVGKFVLPRIGYDIVDESEPARYLRSWKEDLPEYLWMPMEYYGEGVDQHFYHVFGTPLYYRLPQGAVV